MNIFFQSGDDLWYTQWVFINILTGSYVRGQHLPSVSDLPDVGGTDLWLTPGWGELVAGSRLGIPGIGGWAVNQT